MKLYYQNARGLRSKIKHLRSHLDSTLSEVDIFAISESWLVSSINSSEFKSQRFNIFRTDRVGDTRGGGILLGVKKSYKCKEFPTHPGMESIFARVTGQGRDFMIAICYFPPDSHFSIFTDFVAYVDDLSMRFPDLPWIILGDFNLEHIEWSNGDDLTINVSPSAKHNDAQAAVVLIDLANSLELKQFYPIYPNKEYTLDLAFAKSCSYVSTSDICLLDVDSHHLPIFMELQIAAASERDSAVFSQEGYYDFRNCDSVQISSALECVDWGLLFGSVDFDAKVNIFYKTVRDIIYAYTPFKITSNKDYPSWYSYRLIKMIKRKNFIHSRLRRGFSLTDYRNFCALRVECKLLSKLLYKNYCNKVEDSLKSDPKAYWSYVNSLRG